MTLPLSTWSANTAWSEDILGQLDMGQPSKFPALLTYRQFIIIHILFIISCFCFCFFDITLLPLIRYSCGIRVLRMMRERTMGNSVTQLYKKLQEQHSEAWMEDVLQYLTACEPFTRSTVVRPSVFAESPCLPALPKPKWLSAVYVRVVLSQLHEVKAKITSIFGSVYQKGITALFYIQNFECIHNRRHH